ncbi:MAG: DUF4445 domain-containing protein, partial [Anaerolineales bacterium]|nr:DUF4445 domain-containing protein [Anaerolineales bacterium]
VCGGGGTCRTCRVRIIEGSVSEPVEVEARVVTQGLRLACQTRVLGPVRVDVPHSSMTAPQRAQVEGMERPIEFAPSVHVYDVKMDPAHLHDLRADSLRLRDALREQYQVEVDSIDITVARELPIVARRDGWRSQVVTHDGDVIALLRSDVRPLGLAVDIGTTKVAAYLVDLISGDTLGATGTMNPQIAYGEDVMARISYAMQDAANGRKLQEVIVAGLDEMVSTLCQKTDRSPADIVEAVLVGNTCMHHMVVGLPVSQLGMAPYLAAVGEAIDIKARDLGLHLAPGANVHLLPNIAGFVGADHISMIIGAGLFDTQEVTVGLDIGTNTEICLIANGRLLSCSCASGPAFEGAHIHDGMRAAPGAIEWIRLSDGKVEYQTIDNAPPVGICGSGILDGVAELRRIGVIRPNGSMDVKSHERIRLTDEGPQFVLVPAGEREAPGDVVITRKDVNEIQLAKAAIRAGVEVLLAEAGLEDQQIERIVVAGAFGTYLDIDSAVSVGMFPDLPRERFSQVGNAAGIGAKNVLLSRRCRQRAAEIAQRMEYIELTTHPDFVSLYSDALILP